MSVRAVIQVCDRDNDAVLASFLVDDANGFARNVDGLGATGEKLGEVGSGAVTIQRDHPAAVHCVPGRVIRVCAQVDEDEPVPVWAFDIVDGDDTELALRQSDETLVLDGSGLLGRWSGVKVAPWVPGRPASADRLWNWAAPRGFDDSGWSTTNYFQTRVVEPAWPTTYPVAQMYAGMLWSAPSSISHPAGSVLFRRTFEVESSGQVVSYHSADDAANVWASGVLLNRHSVRYPDRSGWEKTWREVVPVDAGEHTFAYEAQNLATGGAYFMATIMEITGEGVAGEPYASTGDDLWRWLDVGTGPKPGFTALQILEMLLDEAQERGQLVGWTIEPHGVFDEIEEFSCRVGASYLDVLEQLAVADIDVAASAEGLVLHVWPWGERGGSDKFDFNISELDELSVKASDDVVTAVLVVWSDGATWVERADHPVLGRVEDTLMLGSVTDRRAVTRIAEAFLDAHAEPSVSIVGSCDVLPVTPGVDFVVGDSGTVGGYEARCVGISYGVDSAGCLVGVPEWGALSSLRRRRRLRSMDRMVEPFESPASASLLTSDTLLVSGFPSTGTWTWSWSGDVDELNDDDPDKPSQVARVETLSRLWKLEVEIDPDDLPDAWGDTTIRILKNGSLLNALYNVTLSTTVAKASIQIWAYEVVSPGDRLQVQAYTQGGHVDGRVTLHYCDAI